MNPAQRYFTRTVARQAAFMRAGAGERVPYFASHLEVELTNNCNLRCPFCPTEELRRPRAFLPLPLFARVLRQLRRRRLFPRVSFCGDGEMLLHPRLADAVALAKKHGFHTSLITNGVLCDDRRARALIAAGLDRIQFSVDSIDARQYARSRPAKDGRNNFRAVMANVLNFLDLNLAAGQPVHVTVMSVQTKGNARAGGNFADYWRKLPVDNVFLSPVYSMAGNLQRRYRDAAGYRGAAADKPACVVPFILLCLKADGTLLACSHDSHAVYPLARLRAGRRFDLEKVWNNRRTRTLRRAQLAHDFAPLQDCGLDCASCSAPLQGNDLRDYARGRSAAKVKTIAASMQRRQIRATAAQRAALAKERAGYV